MSRSLLVPLLLVSVATASVLRPSNTMGSGFQMRFDFKSFSSDPIPSDFASFSYEVPCAPLMFSEKVGSRVPCTGAKCPHHHDGPWAPRKSYANLLNLLRLAANGTRGPNIRIGGESADQTWFSTLPDGPLGPNDYHRVTVQDIATYGYVSQWNGTVAIDLNINQDHNTTNSVEYAVAVSQLLPPDVISAFEVGNEPGIFGVSWNPNKIRPQNWTYDAYNREFQRYADALQTTGNIQMPRIQGAVFAYFPGDWTAHLNSYTEQWTTKGGAVGSNAQNLLSTVSQHYYSNYNYPTQNATIAKLMAPAAASDVTQFGTHANYARSRGVPFVIGEGNSVAGGGKLGVSNVFAAALWGIDTMSYAATSNMSRWNFHGCPGGAYTPIAIAAGHAVARPLFYGMWFFNRMTAGGARFVSCSVQNNMMTPDSPLISAWATVDTGNLLRVALLQKTVINATNTTMRVQLGSSYANLSGKLVRLEAAGGSLSEEHDIRLGGQTLNGAVDGTPIGTPTFKTVTADSGGEVKVAVNPASATLLEFQL